MDQVWNLNSIHILRYCSFCLNFGNLLKNYFCTSMASLWVMYGENQILRKLIQRSSLMLLWWFQCDKVDLTAEIKISVNVLSLFGALYTLQHTSPCMQTTHDSCSVLERELLYMHNMSRAIWIQGNLFCN